jgi:hypothetical protein
VWDAFASIMKDVSFHVAREYTHILANEGSSKISVFSSSHPLSFFDMLLETRGMYLIFCHSSLLPPWLGDFVFWFGCGSFPFVLCFPPLLGALGL